MDATTAILQMDPTIAIVAGVIVLIVLAGAIFLYQRSRRSEKLRAKFGPEYRHAVEETGDKRRAETKLHKLEKRVERFHVHPIKPEERERYMALWRTVKGQFVDDPKAAIAQADELLGQLMASRGYPMSDFEQRFADLSVDYPHVVQNYRAAHDIAEKHRRGDAGTEDMRHAMLHYRALVEALVADAEPAHAAAAE